MSRTVAIIGAGVMGRLLALELAKRNFSVTIFEKNSADQLQSDCSSFVAAGMLAPFCEAEHTEPLVTSLGIESLKLWPKILREFDSEVFFQTSGSLMISHPGDYSEFEKFKFFLEKHLPADRFMLLNQNEISKLEPDLEGRFDQAVYFENEGQIDTRQFLRASTAEFLKRDISLRSGEAVEPESFNTTVFKNTYDWVIDCRGFSAKKNLVGLRGVRGEVITLQTSEITLNRPIRLMHPRYPIYIVPRPENKFVIGATQIESEELSPLTVRSSLELLSAAYSVAPAFAEAHILETAVGLRPAFSDQLPRVGVDKNLISINGLFRHGYLMGPAMAKLAADYIELNKINPNYASVFQFNEKEARNEPYSERHQDLV